MYTAAKVVTYKMFDPTVLHLACVRGALIYLSACFPLFGTIKQLPGPFEAGH